MKKTLRIFISLWMCVSEVLVLAQSESKAAKTASAMTVTQAPEGTQQQKAGDTDGKAAFQKIKNLVGEWEAPLGDGGVMINIFTPFAYGTKIFAQEWENGKYITSTIFYMVGQELRADHFCDYKNEPHYVVKPSSTDPATLQFQFRYATNLGPHPIHFHSTTWRIVDNDHLIQDWYTEGDKKPTPPPLRMEFTRKKLSLRPDGSPAASSGSSDSL